ncbi:MAG: ABC transporter ATP-binding protein [Candidatus Omnitrophica bacterium]|nr:ABC transporter ATP-binding protein [Candidatus Omnitrophota bacterium]
MERLLSLEHLTVCLQTPFGQIPLIEDICLSIPPATIVGVVGESGCGKSMTALAITRLLPERACSLTAGAVFFRDIDLARCSEKQLQQVRGRRIAYVFQEPATSLNPVLTVYDQIAEAVILHAPEQPAAGREDFIAAALQRVGIAAPREKMRRYPHQLSGGEKQRVMLALALVGNPAVLIADEPTTALDVTVQAQILCLLKRLQQQNGFSVLFISHDLNVIGSLADYVVVMYAGQIVEKGPAAALLNAPKHPYTRGLLQCLPGAARDNDERVLPAIPGEVPRPESRPAGCRFHPRCPQAFALCGVDMPPPAAIGDDQEVRCWLYLNSTASPNSI